MKKSGTGQGQDQATLVTSLMRADAYPHPVTKLELYDTHISWVILTGPFAYKIKKALKLEFLDFSTLELRRHFCEEELRLNRRWAPELYLDVVTVAGSQTRPVLGGAGAPLEYAVKMLQFEQEFQLDKQLGLDRLTAQDMRDLAETIDGYHAKAEIVPLVDEEQAVDDVSAPMFENFPPLQGVANPAQLDDVRSWTENTLDGLRGNLLQRREAGFVRECHGDLHLTNLVRLPSGIVPYDCVEFAPELRVMDVLSDLSFLVMDLVARGRPDLGFVLLNRYLEKNGDYSGMTVFGLYFVYHCMIRAKVAAIRSTERSLEELKSRLAVAVEWIELPPPVLVLMHGFSGSGKTWLSSQLLPELPAIRIRSDIERKRLHGLGELERSESGVEEGIYTKSATTDVYDHMMKAADSLLGSGFNVILDASFLRQSMRRAAEELAGNRGASFVILETTTAKDELERRLRQRAESGADSSEAGREVLDYQLDHADPLDDAERQCRISIATDQEFDLAEIMHQVRML